VAISQEIYSETCQHLVANTMTKAVNK